MIFTISLAGVPIRIESLFDGVYRLCRDYRIPDCEGAVELRISRADIDAEREKSLREELLEGLAPRTHSDAYLETLAVYRKIAEALLPRNVFLLHGSAVGVGECSWIFTAPSGVGKSTHTRLWLEHIPGSYVINGDKPLIRVGREIEVFGTPWAGKEGWNRNTAVPLKGVVLLERGPENRIEPIGDAFPALLAQVYRPADAAGMQKTLALLSALMQAVPFYRLRCNMDPEAALVAFKGVTL